MHSKVLVIDDDPDIQLTLSRLLEQNGYAYVGAASSGEGLEALRREAPDILLVDVMLPDTNGFNLCRQIRQSGCDSPVIFVSAKGDIVDKEVGFTSGGDDYVVKPFDPHELLLRIEAILRRANASRQKVHVAPSGSYEVGDLRIEFDKYAVYKAGQPVKTTSKEFEILALLASSPGKVFTREQIHEHLWGSESAFDANNITVLVRRLRKRIEDNPSSPRYLLTVWRTGYKIAETV